MISEAQTAAADGFRRGRPRLSREDAGRLVTRSLGLGVADVSRLAGGHTNTTFLITLASGRRVVLRVRAGERERAETETRWASHLVRERVATPRVLEWAPGQVVLDVARGTTTYHAVLLEHIDGHHPSTYDDLTRAGEAIGRLHGVSAGPMGTTRCLYRAVRDDLLPAEFSRVCSLRASDLIPDLMPYLETEAPRVCHGQLYSTNVLLRDNQGYLIDLETMGMGSAILDLGGACFGMLTSEATTIDGGRAAALFGGYSAVRPEVGDLTAASGLAAALFGLGTALWRFHLRPESDEQDALRRQWPQALLAAQAWCQFRY